jgi:predicted TIM-barrel fold metal-dependent hydrolase
LNGKRGLKPKDIAMGRYEVIDAHVHTYKTPEIGRQALSGFDASGCCGTPEELVPIMQDAGIRKAVQCNMTPARSMFEAALAGVPADQVEGVRPALLEKISDRIIRRNEWTCRVAQEQPGLIAFISVDPIMGQEAMLAELLDKIDDQGARGLKIHPGEGRFYPDDPSLVPVYEAMAKRGLPVISHGGLDIANPDPSYTRPAAFAGVAQKYPGLNLVIAHLGNNFFDESVQVATKYSNVFFDTSAVIPGDENGEPLIKENALSNSEAVQLIRKIGVERVMFGTDYPWFNPIWDLKRFLKLDFSETEKEALLGVDRTPPP